MKKLNYFIAKFDGFVLRNVENRDSLGQYLEKTANHRKIRAIGSSTFIYFCVSGTCLLLHNAIMITADKVGLPLTAGIFLSFTTLAIVGYVLHSIATFRAPITLAGLGRYTFAMSINIPTAWITTWFWRDPIGLPMVYAAPIASGCMIPVNFALNHWAIAVRRSQAGRMHRS